MNINVIETLVSAYNADSVEWCPVEPYLRLFVCGHYQLEEDHSNGTSDAQRPRFGSIELYEYVNSLRCIQSIDTPAVLDQKWCHHALNNKPALAVTTSKGSLNLYTLETGETDPVLCSWVNYTFPDDGKDRLILSVDWSTGKYPSNSPQIVISDNRGLVHLMQLGESEIVLIKSWNLYNESAWIAAFDYWHPQCVFSGADDATFILTNSDTGVHVRNSTHECGVTAVHCNRSREHVIATGSYDTYVRIWDVRSLRAPLDEVRMKGPVWRVKWDPLQHRRLLVACMDGGVGVVDTAAAGAMICGEMNEHNSLAYGVDWCCSTDDSIFASCSFYDNLICVCSY